MISDPTHTMIKTNSESSLSQTCVQFHRFVNGFFDRLVPALWIISNCQNDFRVRKSFHQFSEMLFVKPQLNFKTNFD